MSQYFWLSHYGYGQGEQPELPVLDCGTCDRSKLQFCKTHDYSQYKKSLKCCSYNPFWPNYQVGGWLADGGSFSDLPQENLLFLKVGVAPTQSYMSEFLQEPKDNFGQNENLKCSFFNSANGSCKIWDKRPHVCATYHCHYESNEQRLSWEKFEQELYFTEWKIVDAIYELLEGNQQGLDEQKEFLKYESKKEITVMNSATATAYYKSCFSQLDCI